MWSRIILVSMVRFPLSLGSDSRGQECGADGVVVVSAADKVLLQ